MNTAAKERRDVLRFAKSKDVAIRAEFGTGLRRKVIRDTASRAARRHPLLGGQGGGPEVIREQPEKIHPRLLARAQRQGARVWQLPFHPAVYGWEAGKASKACCHACVGR